jgi:selenocysteine-specific elongation factor
VAVLVIASDEGVMPQTREHLDICRLLGVRAGLIALTKSDLLEGLGPDWLELVRADLAALTQGTFLEGAPVIPVSARTGAGLDVLVEALDALAAKVPERSAEGPAFLPIDRAFSLKGFGTVVTGTLLSGQLAAEDQVSILPGLAGPYRVRSLQVHGKPPPGGKALAGQRTAVNVPGLEPEQIPRGHVLVRHEELVPTRMLDVELSVLPAIPSPLKKREKLLLHLGTAQVEATVALLDLEELAPGETGLAQLRLGEEVAALPDQRFILRGFRTVPGRGTTVAGGRVLATTGARRRRGATELLAPLLEAGPDQRLAWLLRQAGYRGLTAKELFGSSGIPQKALQRSLELLGSRGAVVLVDRERRLYVSAEVLAGLQARALALLTDFHDREPMREGLSREELRSRLSETLDPRIFSRVLQALVDGGKLELAGETVRLPGRGRTLTLSDEGARARLFAELSGAGLAPPTVKDLADRLKLPVDHVLGLLKVGTTEGALCRVSEELYFERRALDALKEKLVGYLKEHREISTPAFKELVGQSRKFVIPLSEYFDREKVTLRVGEKRLLRKG